MAIETLRERIEKKQDRRGPDRCWPWLGYCHPDGEPRIWVDDKIGSISIARAHYLTSGDEIPLGKEALGCPAMKECSNPKHFSLADRTEVANRILAAKGLRRRPTSHGAPRRTLSGEQIQQIFLSHEPTSLLARKYSVSEGQISNIRAGRRHWHLTEGLRS
jgi:hypothetical protein